MKKQALQLAMFLGLTFLAIGLYNNCQGSHEELLSQVQTDLQSFDPNANPEDVQQKAIALALHSGVEGDLCLAAENFNCEQRIFSPSIADGHQDNLQVCTNLDSGDSFCVATQAWMFDTQSALASCDGCDPQEYDRTENICYFNKAKLQGVYPIRVESDSIQEALKGAQSLCQKLMHEQSTH